MQTRNRGVTCVRPAVEHQQTKAPESGVSDLMKKHQCNVCLKNFSRKDTLAAHKFRHTGERPHKCEQCSQTFAMKSYLAKHMVSHSKTKTFKCSECVKTFAYRSGLNAHKLQHSGERPTFSCEKCQTLFRSQSACSQHIQRHHGNADNVTCSVCEKVFMCKAYLNKHMHTHKGTKRYHCEKCGKGFLSNQSYQEHLLRHDRAKQIQCEVCGRRFFTSRELNKHLKFHTKLTAHHCEACKMYFSTSSALIKHRIKSHPRVYPCRNCTETFTDKKKIISHMSQRHGISIQVSKDVLQVMYGKEKVDKNVFSVDKIVVDDFSKEAKGSEGDKDLDKTHSGISLNTGSGINEHLPANTDADTHFVQQCEAENETSKDLTKVSSKKCELISLSTGSIEISEPVLNKGMAPLKDCTNESSELRQTVRDTYLDNFSLPHKSKKDSNQDLIKMDDFCTGAFSEEGNDHCSSCLNIDVKCRVSDEKGANRVDVSKVKEANTDCNDLNLISPSSHEKCDGISDSFLIAIEDCVERNEVQNSNTNQACYGNQRYADQHLSANGQNRDGEFEPMEDDYSKSFGAVAANDVSENCKFKKDFGLAGSLTKDKEIHSFVVNELSSPVESVSRNFESSILDRVEEFPALDFDDLREGMTVDKEKDNVTTNPYEAERILSTESARCDHSNSRLKETDENRFEVFAFSKHDRSIDDLIRLGNLKENSTKEHLDATEIEDTTKLRNDSNVKSNLDKIKVDVIIMREENHGHAKDTDTEHHSKQFSTDSNLTVGKELKHPFTFQNSPISHSTSNEEGRAGYIHQDEADNDKSIEEVKDILQQSIEQHFSERAIPGSDVLVFVDDDGSVVGYQSHNQQRIAGGDNRNLGGLSASSDSMTNVNVECPGLDSSDKVPNQGFQQSNQRLLRRSENATPKFGSSCVIGEYFPGSSIITSKLVRGSGRSSQTLALGSDNILHVTSIVPNTNNVSGVTRDTPKPPITVSNTKTVFTKIAPKPEKTLSVLPTATNSNANNTFMSHPLTTDNSYKNSVASNNASVNSLPTLNASYSNVHVKSPCKTHVVQNSSSKYNTVVVNSQRLKSRVHTSGRKTDTIVSLQRSLPGDNNSNTKKPTCTDGQSSTDSACLDPVLINPSSLRSLLCQPTTAGETANIRHSRGYRGHKNQQEHREYKYEIVIENLGEANEKISLPREIKKSQKPCLQMQQQQQGSFQGGLQQKDIQLRLQQHHRSLQLTDNHQDLMQQHHHQQQRLSFQEDQRHDDQHQHQILLEDMSLRNKSDVSLDANLPTRDNQDEFLKFENVLKAKLCRMEKFEHLDGFLERMEQSFRTFRMLRQKKRAAGREQLE